MTYVYVYENEDVCDGVCGGEAFDGGGGGGGGGGELGISGKRLCSATGVPSEELVGYGACVAIVA